MAVQESAFPMRELNLNGVVNASCTESYGVRAWGTCEVAAGLKDNSGTWGTAVVKMQKSDDGGDTWTTDESFSITGESITTGIDITDTWWIRFLVTTLEGAAGIGELTVRVIGFHDVTDFDATTTHIGRVAKRSRVIDSTDPGVGDTFTVIHTSSAITAAKVVGVTDQGTVDFNLEIRNELTPAVAGTDVLTADLQAAAAGATTTTFDNSGAVATDKWLIGTISAVTGDPGRLYGAFKYTID